jgi:hypothetical protein
MEFQSYATQNGLFSQALVGRRLGCRGNRFEAQAIDEIPGVFRNVVFAVLGNPHFFEIFGNFFPEQAWTLACC